MENMINILKIAFPGMMVAGALGSLVVNLISKGDWPTSIQWLGSYHLVPQEPQDQLRKKDL